MADSSIYPPGVVNPTVPPEQDTPYPPMPDITSNPPPGSTGPMPGTATTPNPGTGTAPFDLSALKWIAALFLLWVILTALTEWSDEGKNLGRAFAGLVLVGAVYKLGPQAIANVQNVWTGAHGTGTNVPNTTTGG